MAKHLRFNNDIMVNKLVKVKKNAGFPKTLQGFHGFENPAFHMWEIPAFFLNQHKSLTKK